MMIKSISIVYPVIIHAYIVMDNQNIIVQNAIKIKQIIDH